MMDGGEGDGFISGGEWAVEFGADELVFLWAGVHAGEGTVPARVWCSGFGYGDFAGTGAAFVERGHGGAPVACGLGAVFLVGRELNQFYCFGEGVGSNFGADGVRGAEV